MSKDYYQVLGITKGASADEIKRAYRELAHRYHPDKNKGDDKRFKEINEAYQVLGDKEKREQYDRFGRTFEGAPGGGFSYGGFGDFGNFSDILEELFGFGRRSSTRRSEGGFEDIFGGGFSRGWSTVQTTLNIDFITAILGGEVEVLVRGEKINLKIPAGIENGEALVHHHRNGDIIFVVNIKMPSHISKKAKELLENLRSEIK